MIKSIQVVLPVSWVYILLAEQIRDIKTKTYKMNISINIKF